MCDKKCRQLHEDYQKLLLTQIQTLSKEVRAWRLNASASQRWSMEEFIKSTDSCGWEFTLSKGILQFPSISKTFFNKLFDLFKF